MRLKDKLAVITGAASGIGLATARMFAREGARVALVDRDAAGLVEAQAAIGPSATSFTCDVADDASVQRTAAAIEQQLGAVDVLVTAAGYSPGKIAHEIAVADWDAVFAVNVKGTWLWCKAVLPGMMARRRGAIVTVASQLAVSGGRNNCAYVTTKGAILSLTRSIALDYVSYGIRCNAILPGATMTPLLEAGMQRANDPARYERLRSRHPMDRFGTADEVAAGILYLASDESSWTTGVHLPVDGGWIAG